jgi:hypothetical protein
VGATAVGSTGDSVGGTVVGSGRGSVGATTVGSAGRGVGTTGVGSAAGTGVAAQAMTSTALNREAVIHTLRIIPLFNVVSPYTRRSP